MKKKDFIVIVLLCLMIGVGYFIFQMMQGEKDTVEVYYKNELVQRIDISVDKIYTFEGSYGKFNLEVKDRQYHAVDVECPNHDCEKMGWMKEGSSKSIICVPNEIYVIQAGTEDQIQ